ncbi:preQ(1) synthase [Ferroacidibacillus organovorans]|uniref:NADPH-dependent 7-cyano-7-deazaguanine reductase n=1 Tax=Ferroacidibacillus organovorans TaxID=1765683 RepID=A0A101XRA9_9BACL|nr:preQ(1) synthase [Ferroacidibacillus organovorans]KUO96103.1 7-cyano-7-deazaguanine reductase [Ferroacidibacillus organovorans]
MSTKPSKELDPIPNPYPHRDYEITIEAPEFTTLCPKTGQPDFGTITIRYRPGPYIIELKSLKLYLWSFRDEGHFHEEVSNLIADDFIKYAKPKYMELIGRYNVRGGISTNVRVEYVDGEIVR